MYEQNNGSDPHSLKLTTGAVIIAIFAVLLIVNRQTGSVFEEFFLYLFPIPMVAFSAQYGWKSSLPVLFAMAVFAFFFGTFTTIFYAVTEAFIGLVFGTCIYKKVDMTKTLIAVMILSVVVNVLNTIVLADLFGINLQEEVAQLQTFMDQIFAQTGVAIPEGMLSENYVMQMLVISMVMMGVIQGFIVYEVSLLILRRLRFNVQKPKPLFFYFPAKATGYLALIAFAGYNRAMLSPVSNRILQTILQTAGLLANIYLVVFGFIAIMFYVRYCKNMSRLIGIVACLACFLIMPYLEMIAGFFYITTNFHRNAIEGNQAKPTVPPTSASHGFRSYQNPVEDTDVFDHTNDFNSTDDEIVDGILLSEEDADDPNVTS